MPALGSGPVWHGAAPLPKISSAPQGGFHVRVLCLIFQSQLIGKASLSQSLVTYRKQGRVLIAPELWRIDLSAEKLDFYKRAWKAACAKARSLGWIY
jgi:hypothetical protein